MKIIDISRPIYEGMPVYPGTAETKITAVKSGSGTSMLSELLLTTHTGTHIDAPSHSVAGKNIKELNLEAFYGPVRVIDLTNVVGSITQSDLAGKNFSAGERILFKTQNSQRDLSKFYDDFVYLDAEAAEYLAGLGIALVGIDALSIKKRGAQDNSSHTNLLSKDIPILEGVNLKNVAEGSYTLVAFPLALAGDGSPVRAILIGEDDASNEDRPVLRRASLFTDGGSRGNPGASAIAYVICNMDNSVVEKSGKYIGITTNNQAEYQGLLAGLERAIELGVEDLVVNMDSELVIKQINGQYKIKNADLLPHYSRVKELAERFQNIIFQHVPRALNSLADKEVNRILDENK